MSRHNDFFNHGLFYLQAARNIWEESDDDNMIAPTCFVLGHSLELFFKADFLFQYYPDENPTPEEEQCREKALKRLGHNLLKMWESKWASNIRSAAENAALQGLKSLSNALEVRQIAKLNPKDELQKHIQYLGEAFGSDLEYALKYPPIERKVWVPSPDFLFPVFEGVEDDIRNRIK